MHVVDVEACPAVLEISTDRCTAAFFVLCDELHVSDGKERKWRAQWLLPEMRGI
jgi:hypothetical protein